MAAEIKEDPMIIVKFYRIEMSICIGEEFGAVGIEAPTTKPV